MEVRDLAILRILQETRNITHAADRLYMAQSAVSKRVKAIERELGVVLLLRSRHGVRFTPAGEAVLRYEKAAGSQLEQLHQELSRLQQGAAEGTLRVGAVTPYALGRLPPALAAYKKCAPAVAVQVVTGTNRDLQQQMLDGTLDLAVTTAECRWDGPRYFLPQEPFCLAYAAPHQACALQEQTYLSYPLEPAQESMVRLWLHENDLPYPGRSSAVDLAVCRELVRSGVGWSILPRSLVPKGASASPLGLSGGAPLRLSLALLSQWYVAQLPALQQFVAVLREGGAAPCNR